MAKIGAFFLLFLVTALPVTAESAPDIYVDNHRVKCTVLRSGGEIYVEPHAVASAMHATCTDSGGQPTVNGHPLKASRQGLVSLKELVAAAGAQLRINPAVGIVDVITFDPKARAQAIEARERERQAMSGASRPPTPVDAEMPVSPAQMDGLYQFALAQMRGTLGMGMTILPTCHWVTLREIRRNAGELVLGYTTSIRIDGKLYLEIYVPYDLAYAATLHIMVHELAHCWEHNNEVNMGTKIIGEGFAEWTAYTVLKGLGYDKESEKAFRLPEEYSEGFKYFERMAQRIGAVATVEHVRQMKR